jgi:8-oxo-dGTP diphosphatase
MKMKKATLCFPIKENKILLGNKKRGFGKNKINGFGGKIEENETTEQAAIREVYEETQIKAKKENLKKVGKIDFVFPCNGNFNHQAYVYFIEDWEGTPKETEEMTCKWFDIDQIPFEKMWDADKHWMPFVLDNKKIDAYFEFNSDNSTINNYKINIIE